VASWKTTLVPFWWVLDGKVVGDVEGGLTKGGFGRFAGSTSWGIVPQIWTQWSEHFAATDDEARSRAARALVTGEVRIGGG
jgi:hypothetical protein